jgi:hypothetical protein
MDLELIFAWIITVLAAVAAVLSLVWIIVWLWAALRRVLRPVTSVEAEYRAMADRRQ